MRIINCDPTDLKNLRGFSTVFSGYDLFNMKNGENSVASNQTFSEDRLELISQMVKEKNLPFVKEWELMIKEIPQKFIFKPLQRFGECGHLINGIIINNDTNTYQERVNIVYESGLGEWLEKRYEKNKTLKICEIGGGYGALALWFKSAFPESSYTIIDLPESLLFSQLYLGLSDTNIKMALQQNLWVEGGSSSLPSW